MKLDPFESDRRRLGRARGTGTSPPQGPHCQPSDFVRPPFGEGDSGNGGSREPRNVAVSEDGDGNVPCRLAWGRARGRVGAGQGQGAAEAGLVQQHEFSLVVTAGNSAAETWGFSDRVRHVWKDARFELEGKVVRSDTSDDRFFMVAPGLEFPVGGAPANRPPRSSSLTRPWMSPITSSAEATNGTSPRDSSGTRAPAGTATTMPAS